MSDERNNIDQMNNDLPAAPEASVTPPPAVPDKVEGAQDISKVKIRTILRERIKKCGTKKILAFILVAIFSFAAGAGVDRALVNQRKGRAFNNRAGISNQLPNNRFNQKMQNNNNFNNNNNNSNKGNIQ